MQANQIIFLSLSIYLTGFVIFILLRERISEKIVNLVSIPLNITGFILSLFLLLNSEEEQVFSYNWIQLGDQAFAASLLVNRLTVVMFSLVQFIALLVQIFSVKYMKHESRYTIYYAFLNLFVFSMLGLVASGSLLLIFCFWELVGFCSYLLIGFWYEKRSATNASLKAFLMNRIGDTGFLIGIGLVAYQFGTLELSGLSAITTYAHTPLLTLTGLALFCGCIGKSAQFPLQTWLPDAMEGPTPVSALIHAATMVAAGIFLLDRIHFIITPTAAIVIAAVGAFTALISAYSALFQFDIKKVLAYSTISQLGLMVMTMGVGNVNAALFHLFTHAFFKAGLFLIAGAIIYHLHHEQDMRKMGSLLYKKPWLALAYLICGAALAGMPFTSGFLSKDAAIISVWNWALTQESRFVLLIPIMGLTASVLTAVYVTRQFVMVFVSKENMRLTWTKPDLFELLIFPLLLASLWFTQSVNPLDFEHVFFANWFPIPNQENHWLGYALLVAAVPAIYFTFKKYLGGKFSVKPETFWQRLGYHHYFIDEIYARKIVPFFVGKTANDEIKQDGEIKPDLAAQVSGNNQKNLSFVLFWIDSKIVDGFTYLLSKLVVKAGAIGSFLDTYVVDGLVKGVAFYVSKTGKRLKRIQDGQIQSYITALALFLIALFLILNLL
jgi:NADH-quinone oxidoreductase subunit L